MWGSGVILWSQRGPAFKNNLVIRSTDYYRPINRFLNTFRPVRESNQLPIQWVLLPLGVNRITVNKYIYTPVSRVPFAGVKQSDREADQSAIPSPSHTFLVCTGVHLSCTCSTKILQTTASHDRRRVCHHHYHLYLYHHREIYRLPLVNPKTVHIIPSVDNRIFIF